MTTSRDRRVPQFSRRGFLGITGGAVAGTIWRRDRGLTRRRATATWCGTRAGRWICPGASRIVSSRRREASSPAEPKGRETTTTCTRLRERAERSSWYAITSLMSTRTRGPRSSQWRAGILTTASSQVARRASLSGPNAKRSGLIRESVRGIRGFG